MKKLIYVGIVALVSIPLAAIGAIVGLIVIGVQTDLYEERRALKNTPNL